MTYTNYKFLVIDFPHGTDTSKQDTPQVTSIEDCIAKGRPKSIEKILVIDDGKKLITYRSDGLVELYRNLDSPNIELISSWSTTTTTNHTTNDKRDKKTGCVGLVYHNSNIISCTNNGIITKINISNVEEEGKEGEVETIEMNNSSNDHEISCFVQNPFDDDTFAIGGKDWDVEFIKLNFSSVKIDRIFKAKNVKNDRLNMAVPIWITNIRFLSPTKFLTTTGYGQIRIYDITKGKRPMSDIKVSDRLIKPLVGGNLKSNSVIFADNHSNISQFSLETHQLSGKYHGSTGAVQALHATDTLLAAVGLDRYLRVFNLVTREQVGKVFIGTHLTDVWILDGKDELEKRKKQNNEDDEDDEMWQELNKKSNIKKAKKNNV